MRVADYIVEALLAAGTDRAFMLSGGGAIYLDDALACHPRLRTTGVKNEATAPMMAEAYARIIGKTGVAFVTTGPGGSNAVTGLAEAWVDSAPVLVCSGQVEREYSTRALGRTTLRTYGTQELDIIAIVSPITKYAALVEKPEDIRYHLEKALYLARSGRPGPVWLDIPLDVQSAEIEPEKLRGYSGEVSQTDLQENSQAFSEKTTAACRSLERAKKPLLIIGQGIRLSGATEALRKFLQEHPMPVISSRLGQDILSYDDPCYCGHGGLQGTPATKKIMEEADCILSVGSRLAPSFTGGKALFENRTAFWAVDIEEAELNKLSIPEEGRILCDAKRFLEHLIQALGPLQDQEWLECCRSWKQELSLVYHTKETAPVNIYHFIRKLDDLSDADSIFVSDAGSSYYSTGQCLTFRKAQREITSGAFASMGLTIPLAIGAASASPGSRILAVTGDGSIETNIQELHTLAIEKSNVKLFVINNGGYLSIRNTQDAKFNGRYINSDQKETAELLNFAEVARCFGIPYFSIVQNEDIERVYREVNTFSGPALIEVFTDPKQKIYTCY